jgi:protein-disulfide isomerase
MFQPTVDALLEKYEGKILFAYRHYPLPQHEFAKLAAAAAEAAGEQGKFWEMYRYLFANQERLSEEVIMLGAKEL